MGGEELKWYQLAHHQLMSQQGPHFSPHSKAKANYKAQISGKLVTKGISDVVTALVYLEKTHLKKLIMIIGERAKRVRHPLLLPIEKNVYVCTSKPQCACSQFYVKRSSGRTCIYEKPACCLRVQLRKARFTYIKITTLLLLAP